MAKGEWEAESLRRPNKTKREECDYSNEALAFVNHLKLSMNLCRAFISAVDTESKPSKKPSARVLNFNFLRAGQLQRKCSIVFNSSSYPAIVQLGSVPDPCQRLNLAVPFNKTNPSFYSTERLWRQQRYGSYPNNLAVSRDKSNPCFYSTERLWRQQRYGSYPNLELICLFIS